SEEISHVDEAMELGFGWEMGPLKIIDAVGPEAFQSGRAKSKIDAPSWLSQPAAGDARSYKPECGNIAVKELPKNGSAGTRHELTARGFSLARLRSSSKPVVETTDATLWDMGDRILLLEFHSKMNSMGPISLDMILKSVDKANEGYAGLVIGNQGANFCAGANIAMVLVDAANGEFDNIDFAIRQFQRASMAIKYSGVPVVVAPHNM